MEVLCIESELIGVTVKFFDPEEIGSIVNNFFFYPMNQFYNPHMVMPKRKIKKMYREDYHNRYCFLDLLDVQGFDILMHKLTKNRYSAGKPEVDLPALCPESASMQSNNLNRLNGLEGFFGIFDILRQAEA